MPLHLIHTFWTLYIEIGCKVSELHRFYANIICDTIGVNYTFTPVLHLMGCEYTQDWTCLFSDEFSTEGMELQFSQY